MLHYCDCMASGIMYHNIFDEILQSVLAINFSSINISDALVLASAFINLHGKGALLTKICQTDAM